MMKATPYVDAMKESLYRSSLNNHCPYNELGYGYVDFIRKPSSRFGYKSPNAKSTTILIDGLDDGDWRITVELYGLCSTGSGNNKKCHETSKLNESGSSFTPNEELKQQNSSKVPQIDSPEGSSALRNTMYRKLAYFMISSREVNQQQFPLKKFRWFKSNKNASKFAVPIGELEFVRICMRMLEDGEKYVYRHIQGSVCSTISYEKNLVIKPLHLPPECNITKGFITLFDDFAMSIAFEQNETPKWQHFLKKNVHMVSNALWTRLWFKIEVINNPNAQKDDEDETIINDNSLIKKLIFPQTVVLKYWMYHEHSEQNQEPRGIIDLSGCLPLSKGIGLSKPLRIELLPPAQPFSDSAVLPNTLRILFNGGNKFEDGHNFPIYFGKCEPILLAFDTAYERDKWCNTINKAVYAIAAHQEQFHKFHRFKKTNSLKINHVTHN
ncbi:Hypothetical protein CINCED_3A023108 [Cinara cedri]|uniref:PH domain-containing protein n=1 Tax=Cinara cedri TaxID=506608 RepID=A0A5E4N772_9HEMI|nr:Hypothetical protein CINCED_3A023108 [Cinara cedri]